MRPDPIHTGTETNKVSKTCDPYFVTEPAENDFTTRVGNTDRIRGFAGRKGQAVAPHRVDVGFDTQWIQQFAAPGAHAYNHGIRLNRSLVGFNCSQFVTTGDNLLNRGVQPEVGFTIQGQPLTEPGCELERVSDLVAF